MTQTRTEPEASVRAEAHQFTATMISPEAEAYSRQAQARQASPETVATMISPEAERYSRQATLDHHLANVRIAEQQFRAVVANLLTYLASDHRGEKSDVIVTKKGCKSAFGPIEHVGLAYRVGWVADLGLTPMPDRGPVHHFTASQVTSVTEANGYITIHIS